MRARTYEIEHFAREDVAVHVDTRGLGHQVFPPLIHCNIAGAAVRQRAILARGTAIESLLKVCYRPISL
jgi:hypothetical protein